MTVKKVRMLLGLFSVAMSWNVYADDDPCAGLLNLVDRPSHVDTACVMPFNTGMFEFGYQYQQVIHPTAEVQEFPNAELRLGLPLHNEVSITLPTYIHQSISPRYGTTAPVIGVKHEIGYNQSWLGGLEVLVTLPSGSAAFGSNGVGTTVNGIVEYTVNPKISLTFELGGSTQTESSLSGGQRFNSVNPDILLAYSPTDKINVFGEIYGQSKTGPGQSSGFNADAGVLFLIWPKWEIDLEVGQRISGYLNNLNHYVGAGMAVELS